MMDKSVVPEGMVAYGPEHSDYPSMPSDFRLPQGGALLRNGIKSIHPSRWRHYPEGHSLHEWDVTAYTPRSNPLNLKTSDLDPITPEEDALATKAIVAMGWTRQAHDSAVRMVLVVLAELIDRVAEMDMQVLASVVHDARWDQGSAASSWVPYSAEYGSGKVYSMRIANAVQMHLLHMLSAHSIQSGGDGGEEK